MAPSSSDAGTPTLILKLLVGTKGQRVLYAEAGKDVVDFLFSLLALPIATAVTLLGKEKLAGTLGTLYGSVEDLDDTYVQPGAAKDALLRPTALSPATSPKGSLFCLPAPAPSPAPPRPMQFFRCNRSKINKSYDVFGYHSNDGSYEQDDNPCRNYVTDTRGRACPSCGKLMNTETTFVKSAPPPVPPSVEKAAAGGEKGFVRGVVTYTVMDNLKVTPMSTISGITLLNTFGITDISRLQEKTVQLGYAEGFEILRVSLQSKTVLSEVFLGKKHKA